MKFALEGKTNNTFIKCNIYNVLMKGNAARILFREDNENKTLELITADDDEQDIILPTEIEGHTVEGLAPLSR